MANGPLIAPLPWIELGPGYVVALEAIDPTTGDAMPDVTVSDITIYAVEVDADNGSDDTRLPEFLQEQRA